MIIDHSSTRRHHTSVDHPSSSARHNEPLDVADNSYGRSWQNWGNLPDYSQSTSEQIDEHEELFEWIGSLPNRHQEAYMVEEEEDTLLRLGFDFVSLRERITRGGSKCPGSFYKAPLHESTSYHNGSRSPVHGKTALAEALAEKMFDNRNVENNNPYFFLRILKALDLEILNRVDEILIFNEHLLQGARLPMKEGNHLVTTTPGINDAFINLNHNGKREVDGNSNEIY
ncbi:hypothetical protein FXO38_13004 [Capsicum annuum]|nr:hypothetical protein FXO38_13004 [Capsicum annuum]